MTQLKQNYEKACNDYLKAFALKHDFDLSDCFWVANDVGTVCSIGDYFVDMVTIRIDIDRDAPVDEWIEWYDYTLRLGMLDAPYPNYDSWLRGCPIKSEEEIQAMEAMREKIQGLKDELKKMCDENI